MAIEVAVTINESTDVAVQMAGPQGPQGEQGPAGVATVNTQVDQTGASGSSYGELVGDVNGVNTLFTVSGGSYITGSLSIHLNGQLMVEGSDADWVETTPASGTFTFNFEPQIGDRIVAAYTSVVS